MMRQSKHNQILLSHVMQNHADEAIALLKSGDFDHALLENVACSIHPLKLYQISMLYRPLLAHTCWSKEVLPIIERNREGCDKLLAFWEQHYHYPIHHPFNFTPYEEDCCHMNYLKSESNYDYFFEKSFDALICEGYNANELRLCYATLTFDTKRINELLQQDTNPDVFISGYFPAGTSEEAADFNGYNALNYCDTIYSDVFNCRGLFDYLKSETVLEVDSEAMHLLLAAAAYDALEKTFERTLERVKNKNTN